MGETRVFTLGEVLSVTTEKLLAPIGNLYGILNFLTGDNLYTRQLPRASRECKPYILAAHPQLSSVDASVVTPENWQGWLDEQVRALGNEWPLEPMADGIHEYRRPVAEQEEMVGKDRVRTVKVPPEGALDV